jgi:AraC family transcriptional regulator
MDIRIEEVTARPTACVRTHTDVAHIGEAFNAALPRVAERVARVGGTIAGPPYMRYRDWSAAGVDIEVGFPTVTPIPDDGEVVAGELPETEVAIAVHEGAYDRLPESYAELERWIRSQGREPAESMWEMYLTDPDADPDTSHWRTQVVWPLKR